MFVIGHRGASRDHPENTLAAFTGAIDQRADGVELDVRRTGDGALAVSHDDTLPDGRALVELRADELPSGMPLLAEALDACQPLSIVNIEIKNWPDDVDFDPTEALADRVVALLAARGEEASAHYLISGFHLPTIDRVHALAPALATAWLIFGHEAVAEHIDRAAAHGHVALHPHHAFVTEEMVSLAHEAGLAVNAWTCNDPDRIRWLAELGVDAVVTDVPAVALEALGR